MSRRAQSLEMGRIIPERHLSTHFSRVLFTAERDERTGIITLDEGDRTTQLHVFEGRIVYATAGTLVEPFCDWLHANGRIDDSEKDVLVASAGAGTDADQVASFGQLALEEKIMAPRDLHECLSRWISELLCHCIGVEDAFWRWEEDLEIIESPHLTTPLAASVITVLRADGNRWRDVFWALRDYQVHLEGELRDVVRGFYALPGEVRLLKTVERCSIGQLLREPDLDPAQTAALLAGLSCGDRVRFIPPRPSVVPPPNVPEVSQSQRAREAAQRLREEVKRRRQPRRRRADKAASDAELTERGRNLLARGAFKPALEAFRSAFKSSPSSLELRLYLEWTELLLEDQESQKIVREDQLRELIDRALADDAKCAFAHYLRGRLLLQEDDKAAALAAFKRARALDPTDVDVQRYLRLTRARS